MVSLHKMYCFRLHRMHEMQTIVSDARGVCLSVFLSRGSTRLHCARMAEQIKVMFWVNIPGCVWNFLSDVGPDPQTERGGAHF